MTDPIDRLVLAEANFRADVIAGLHREAQRLRQHHTIVDQRHGSQKSIVQLVSVLEGVVDRLRAQDGHLARALGRWDGQEPRPLTNSNCLHSLMPR